MDSTFRNSTIQRIQVKCWDAFMDVIDTDGNLLFGVACCSLCYACLIYKKPEGSKVIHFGTKYLLDHADKCRCCNKTERKQSTMTAFVTRSKPLVTKADKDKLHQNESLFVGRCQLAFYVVVTAYFRRYFYPGRFGSPGQVLPGRVKSWVS